MSKNDIKVRRSSVEPLIMWFPVKASETFVAGEFVRLNTAGELVEATDNAATGKDILGIAAASGDTVGATDANGATRWLAGAFTPGTGFPVSGDLIPVIVATPDTLFYTSNFTTTTGAFVAGSMLKTHVGDGVGVDVTSGVHGVALGGNQTARVVQVLDANLTDIAFSGGTPVHIVFGFTSYQLGADAVNADAGA